MAAHEGGLVSLDLAHWREYRTGKWVVALFGISILEWREIGALQQAVVDDFGNLVQVSA